MISIILPIYVHKQHAGPPPSVLYKIRPLSSPRSKSLTAVRGFRRAKSNISFTCNTHLERGTAIFLFMTIRSDNLPREVWLLFHGRLSAWHCPEAVHMTWGRSLTIEASLATWDYCRKMEILLAMTSNVTQREGLSHVCFPVSMERGGKTTCFPPTIVLFMGG